MRISIEMPDIEDFRDGFPQFWLKATLIGTVSQTYAVNALTASYVRLVEAALTEYRLAQTRLREFWDTHDRFHLYAMHQAVGHFEACITNMHRAIRLFVRLRKSQHVPLELRDRLGPDKPQFIADRVSKLFTDVRDAVHHADEQILNGAIPENSPFMLKPDGAEEPIPNEPGQTLKTIDRLRIGALELSFTDLHRWLRELGRCAQQISEYDPRSSTP